MTSRLLLAAAVFACMLCAQDPNRLAVQRYNVFSGGGPMPPRWGLGLWYRCGSTLKQDESRRDVPALRRL